MSKPATIKFQIKILAVGDLHFDAKNVAQTDAVSREICEVVANDRELDAVVILGDVLNRFATDSVHVLSRAVSFLRSVRKELAKHDDADRHKEPGRLPPAEGRQLWVVIGNHERPNRHAFLTDEHQLTALSEWPNTVVADKVVATTLRGRKFVLVPYVEPGRFLEALGTLPPDEADWRRSFALFAHQEFYGAKLGGAGPSVSGDRYPLDAPLCISGHIHEFSQPQPNILYPGTPYHDGWTDLSSHVKDGANKGPGVSELTFGPGGKLHSHERIRLAGVPRNVTYIFQSPKEFQTAVEEFRSRGASEPQTIGALVESFGETPGPVASLRIKVRATSKDEFAALVSSGRAVKDLAALGVSVSYFGHDSPNLPHPAVVRRDTGAGAQRKNLVATRPFAELIVEELTARGGAPDAAEFLDRAMPDARIKDRLRRRLSENEESKTTA